jgi:mRNA interferase RelE/StbE
VPYVVRLNRRAEKQLDRIPDHDADRIMEMILRLADDPRPPSALKLRGPVRRWRLRVGNYRVIYDVFDADQLVTVEHILRRTTRTYKDV